MVCIHATFLFPLGREVVNCNIANGKDFSYMPMRGLDCNHLHRSLEIASVNLSCTACLCHGTVVRVSCRAKETDGGLGVKEHQFSYCVSELGATWIWSKSIASIYLRSGSGKMDRMLQQPRLPSAPSSPTQRHPSLPPFSCTHFSLLHGNTLTPGQLAAVQHQQRFACGSLTSCGTGLLVVTTCLRAHLQPYVCLFHRQ